MIPLLERGDLDDSGFTFDQGRMNALLQIPALLRNPNCIHANLRHAERGQGGIQGLHMYVHYGKNSARKVAFTTLNPIRDITILVSSFYTYPSWVADCAANPAIYVKPGSKCTCCAQQKSHR